MKASLAPIQYLKLPKFWLFPIAGCLIALHIHLTWQVGLSNLLVTSLAFFAAIFLRLRKKINTISLESGVFSRVTGTLLLASVFISTFLLLNYDFLIRLVPLTSAIGLALVASGFKGLKQYSQELILLVVLALPLEALIQPINQLVGVTTILAKLSTFILWYLGFEVSRLGDIIILPMKSTWVGPNCSGILTMLWMLQLSVLFLVLFPTNFIQKILVPLVSVIIVIGINGIRIAIMAVLAAYNYAAFEYWHSDKAEIFSTIPILVFAFYCKSLIDRNERKIQNNMALIEQRK